MAKFLEEIKSLECFDDVKKELNRIIRGLAIVHEEVVRIWREMSPGSDLADSGNTHATIFQKIFREQLDLALRDQKIVVSQEPTDEMRHFVATVERVDALLNKRWLRALRRRAVPALVVLALALTAFLFRWGVWYRADFIDGIVVACEDARLEGSAEIYTHFYNAWTNTAWPRVFRLPEEIKQDADALVEMAKRTKERARMLERMLSNKKLATDPVVVKSLPSGNGYYFLVRCSGDEYRAYYAKGTEIKLYLRKTSAATVLAEIAKDGTDGSRWRLVAP